MENLNVVFCDVKFSNPLILPAGIITQILKYKKAVKVGAGGITTKSLTIEAREGYPSPQIIKLDYGVLNAVGLRGPGIKKGKEEVKRLIKSIKVPVIASIFSTQLSEIKLLAKEISSINPSLIELDLSCPHVEDTFGESLALGKKSAFGATKIAKKSTGKIPLICKLSPNVPDIGEIAKACEEGGADAISAINTVGPGMVIDIQTKKPLLGNKRGGLSGPAIKPIAIRCIYDIYEAIKIPIIGIGGISSWQDTIEMMMAGATLVGVGSATYLKGIEIFKEIKRGLREYMEKEGIESLKEIIGAAHNN